MTPLSITFLMSLIQLRTFFSPPTWPTLADDFFLNHFTQKKEKNLCLSTQVTTGVTGQNYIITHHVTSKSTDMQALY